MPRRATPLVAGEYYHFYNRGNNRERVFYERGNYLFFLRRLRQYLTPVVDIVAYCLMPTHYHLLVGVKQTSQVSNVPASRMVSNAMMRLAVSYTKALNQRYARVGTVFQGPFQSKHVEKDEYLVHLSRYVHLNPVVDGLVNQAEDWEFSSYRDYVGIRGGTLSRPDIVLSQFPSRLAYREFTESHIHSERGVAPTLLFD